MSEEENEEEDNKDYESHAKKISIDDMIKDDYYKVLGLDELKWRATDEQVRSAYRKLALKYHPDKLAAPTQEDRQIFLKIQDASDGLGNIEKRRAYFLFILTSSYDSADVELKLPIYNTGDDFFECFSDAFTQYSRFSSIQPAYFISPIFTIVLCSVRWKLLGKRSKYFTNSGGNSSRGVFTVLSMNIILK